MTHNQSGYGYSIGKMTILLLFLALILSGCYLDRSGLPAEAEAATSFEVRPSFICPGESTTVTWDVPVHSECGGTSPCSSVISLISSPTNLISPAVRANEVSGSRSVSPPDDLSFRLEAIVCDERGCLDDPTIKTGYVNVLHEEEGTLQAVFEGVCVGANAGHNPFQLDLSPCSEIIAICNRSSEAIHVETRSYGRFDMRADLFPEECTTAFNDIPFPGTSLYARPLLSLDLGGYCGSLETSRIPGSLVLDIYISCNLDRDSCDLGMASEAIVSSYCGDNLCDLSTEDNTTCPADCGGGDIESITPEDTTTATAPPPTPTAASTATFTPQPPPPTAPPTPTPKPSPPPAPDKLAITNKVCNAQEYSVTLGWIDLADNEDGYRVFRGNELIATLKPNATSHVDNPPGSGPYTYGIEAFNNAGASGRVTVYEERCLY
ncbi:MAG: hypothetical protein GTO18_12860 [Anaerolineales bacterium]|nr:hypothetical protein [Anaerolineales bacterium]